MSNNPPSVATEDAAWAEINTPLSEAELIAFCRDVERLFRINPMLEFRKWVSKGGGIYVFQGRNISQEPAFDFNLELKATETANGLQVDYSGGLKSRTLFQVGAAPQGSKLTIVDRYDGVSEEERRERINEVDRSLAVWANYLQQFLMQWQRWSRFAPWRWYMRRIWQPMKPSGRRITYMLLWIGLVEIVLILLGVAIYYLEYA